MATENIRKESKVARNLRNGLSTPAAKISLVVIGILCLGLGGYAINRFRSTGGPASAANAGSFEIAGSKPRGGADGATVIAVAAAADQAAAAAASRGQSYAGPFVFENAGEMTAVSVPGSQASNQIADIFGVLRKRAAEYDAADVNTVKEGAGGQRYESGGTTGTSPVASNAGAGGDYGLGPEGFKQVSKQLERFGTVRVNYENLPNGILSQQAQVVPTTTATPGTGTTANTAAAVTTQRSAEMIAARAGSTCAALPESGYDTDVALPVFATLQECGELRGARIKGTLVKSISNFTVRFTTIYLDPKRGLKTTGQFDAVAVGIANDGAPAIADDVNNHWGTRLASSALLALAKTEQTLIATRGSTSTNTGTSSSTTIEPPTATQVRDARIAGLTQGALEVVTRDVATGVNRQATMTTEKSTLIGVQFLDDVKVVRVD